MRKIIIEKGGLEFSFNINENNNIISKDNTEVNILFLYYSLESKLLNEKLNEEELQNIKFFQEVVKELNEIVEEN